MKTHIKLFNSFKVFYTKDADVIQYIHSYIEKVIINNLNILRSKLPPIIVNYINNDYDLPDQIPCNDAYNILHAYNNELYAYCLLTDDKDLLKINKLRADYTYVASIMETLEPYAPISPIDCVHSFGIIPTEGQITFYEFCKSLKIPNFEQPLHSRIMHHASNEYGQKIKTAIVL